MSLYSLPTHSGYSSERNLKRNERQFACFGTRTRIRQIVTSRAPCVLTPPSRQPLLVELFGLSARVAQPVERIAKPLPRRGKLPIRSCPIATGVPPGGTVTNFAFITVFGSPWTIAFASSVEALSERFTGSIGRCLWCF